MRCIGTCSRALHHNLAPYSGCATNLSASVVRASNVRQRKTSRATKDGRNIQLVDSDASTTLARRRSVAMPHLAITRIKAVCVARSSIPYSSLSRLIIAGQSGPWHAPKTQLPIHSTPTRTGFGSDTRSSSSTHREMTLPTSANQRIFRDEMCSTSRAAESNLVMVKAP